MSEQQMRAALVRARKWFSSGSTNMIQEDINYACSALFFSWMLAHYWRAFFGDEE